MSIVVEKPWLHVNKECLQCNVPLVLRNTVQITRKKFCGRACRQRWRLMNEPDLRSKLTEALPRGPRNHTPPKKLRSCAHCKKEYQPNGANQKWCLECCPTGRYRNIMERYGLAFSDWNTLFEKQNGVCAVCLRRPVQVVDHDHKTGKVRGLLCHGCNSSLGNFFEDTDVLKRAISYIEKGGE